MNNALFVLAVAVLSGAAGVGLAYLTYGRRYPRPKPTPARDSGWSYHWLDVSWPQGGMTLDMSRSIIPCDERPTKPATAPPPRESPNE